jgi:WD40 repeat protein
MSAAEYVGGANAAPKKVSVIKNVAISTPTPTPTPAPTATLTSSSFSVASSSFSVAPASTATTSPAVKASSSEFAMPSTSSTTESIPARAKSLSIVYDKTDARAAIDAKLKTSLYRHVTGSEPRQQDETWFKLNPKTGAYLNQNLQCNGKYWAMPTTAGNGSVIMVQDIKKTGRAVDDPPALKGHKAPVVSFRMSPLDDKLLVSASADGEIKVWTLPHVIKSDVTEATRTLHAKGKITILALSEAVDGLMACGSSGPDGHVLQV